MGRKGAFVQTMPVSSWRTALEAMAGERLLLGLRYGADWGAELPTVEICLLRDGEVVVTEEATVEGHWCEAASTVPAGGIDGVEIRHHLEPESRLPLRIATLLVLNVDANAESERRARRYVRMAGDHRPFSVAQICRQRLFTISMVGLTLDTMLLSSGESRVIPVPAGLDGRRLLGWVAVLDAATGGDPAVVLEAGAGERWTPLARMPVTAGDVGRWRALGAGEGTVLPPGCDAVRLAVNGGDAVVGISGPVLPPGERPADRRNLLVIDLDTLRADRLGSYGYTTRPTSTRMDNLLEARGAHLFEHALSPAAFTLPATAKLLAGRYHDIQHDSAISRQYTLLPELLRESGYYCAAFTGGGQLRHAGFEQGFHEYHWSRDVGKIEDSFPQALAWLEENGDEPFFLFLHTYETHDPYTRNRFCRGLPRGRLGDVTAGELLIPDISGFRIDPSLTREEKTFINAAYDSGVREATDAVADLLAELDRMGLTESTVVVILSDHGEEFWDHGDAFAMHGQSLYGEMIDVPLIIIDPDRPGEGIHRIAGTVSTVDLVPTLLHLLDLPLTVPVDGADLVPLMDGAGEIDRDIPVLACRLDKSFCVVDDGVKLIRPLGPRPWEGPELPAQPGELYRLTDDPLERNNLVETDPELARLMTERLSRAAAEALPPLAESPTPAAPLDRDLQRQLRALGYVDVK
jgi:arylsulfatase A-like enzyme